MGDDPEAAQLSGVQVKRTLISVYMLSGLICAFAGWAMIGGSARLTDIGPVGQHRIHHCRGDRRNLAVWRTRLDHGGSFGALIVGVFTLGLRLLGADAQWTYLLIGVLIIAAVTVDQWIRKVSV
jgi:fructose transport system permease protein